jgi:hypothetical protein
MNKAKIGFWQWLWNQIHNFQRACKDEIETIKIWALFCGLMILSGLGLSLGPIIDYLLHILLWSVLGEILGIFSVIFGWLYFSYWLDTEDC